MYNVNNSMLNHLKTYETSIYCKSHNKIARLSSKKLHYRENGTAYC